MKYKNSILFLSLLLLTGCDSKTSNSIASKNVITPTYSGPSELIMNRKSNFSFKGFSDNVKYESSDETVFKILDDQILGINTGSAFLIAKEGDCEIKIEIKVNEPKINDESLIPEYSYSFDEIVKIDGKQIASVNGKTYEDGYEIKTESDEFNFDGECYYYGDKILNVSKVNDNYIASVDDVNEYVNDIDPFTLKLAFNYKYQLSKCDVKFESSKRDEDSYIDVFTTNDCMINFIGVDYFEGYQNTLTFKNGVLTKLELKTAEEIEENITEIEINFSDIGQIKLDHEIIVEDSNF